jgi:sn-glycerol 3-phosphate transport system permease protein
VKKRNTWSLVADGLVIVVSIIWLLPLLFSILMSFRPQAEPISVGNVFFGTSITLENYQDVFEVAPWNWHLFTTLVFVFGILIVQLITVTFGGYAFARMRFAGKSILLYAILLQLMIPTGVLLVQNFATIRALGLFDTRWALMLPYWGSAFGLLLMRQSFAEIPQELEDAALMDGANVWQVLLNIYIPLSIPAYVAFSLVSISSHWNEYLWPFIVTRTEEVRPLTVGLNRLYATTEVGALYGLLMAGTLLVIAPLVILFLFFQRRFIESFVASGIK